MPFLPSAFSTYGVFLDTSDATGSIDILTYTTTRCEHVKCAGDTPGYAATSDERQLIVVTFTEIGRPVDFILGPTSARSHLALLF